MISFFHFIFYSFSFLIFVLFFLNFYFVHFVFVFILISFYFISFLNLFLILFHFLIFLIVFFNISFSFISFRFLKWNQMKTTWPRTVIAPKKPWWLRTDAHAQQQYIILNDAKNSCTTWKAVKQVFIKKYIIRLASFSCYYQSK